MAERPDRVLEDRDHNLAPRPQSSPGNDACRVRAPTAPWSTGSSTMPSSSCSRTRATGRTTRLGPADTRHRPAIHCALLHRVWSDARPQVAVRCHGCAQSVVCVTADRKPCRCNDLSGPKATVIRPRGSVVRDEPADQCHWLARPITEVSVSRREGPALPSLNGSVDHGAMSVLFASTL